MITLNNLKIAVITVSLLCAAVLWVPFADAAPKAKIPDTTGKSDLNHDGLVDYDDLVIFSSEYLGQNVDTVEWCAFYAATSQDANLYGKSPSFYTKHFSVLLSFIRDHFGCGDLSELTGDGIVNARDLMAFSENYAGEHFLRVDWCAFLLSVLEGEDDLYGYPVDYYLEHYGALMLYVQDKYKCSDVPPPDDPLALKNNPKFLTHIAASRNLTGDYYVTDPKVGSVFIYDSNLVLTRELKGLAKPLGIAVNSSGQILVGNDKRNNVEVYSPDDGTLLASFGESELETPSSIMLDSADNVYVTDAGSNTIYVYDSSYNLMTNIGKPGKDPHQLRSPSNAVLSADETELYVLDRLNQRIQVYDPDGSWLRGIIFEGTDGENCNWFTNICEIPGAPPFTRIQAMGFDATGKLHVLDMFHAVVSIFDPQSGEYLVGYGTYGLADGELKSPTSLLLKTGQALVVDGGMNKIEVLDIPGIPQ